MRANELRIGFAGANTTGTDIGVGQFSRFFTLEGLTYPGPDGRALPRLAESWTWEEDGLRLRVRLRPNVMFHDGTPLNASLAAQILKSAVVRPSNLAVYPSLNDIKSIAADGERDITIDLFKPSAFLPDELSLPFEHGSTQAGTGPYRLVTRDRSNLVFERFSSYYLGRPNIARIVVRPFDTMRTAWSSLLRGEVDMLSDVQPDAVDFIRSDNVDVVSFGSGYQYLVAFNSQRSPFKSGIVRRALNLAIDRREIVNNVFHGSGVPATGPLWPNHWAYDKTIAPYPYDPSAAAALLNTADLPLRSNAIDGHATPSRFQFTCLLASGFGVVEKVALQVQKQLYDVGVDMQFEVLSPAALDARIRRGDFDAVLTDMISGPTLGRPYLFWRSGKSAQGLNVFGYDDPEAERLFRLLSTSRSEAAVVSATRRLQQVFLDDPPALFLAWSNRTRVISRKFQVNAGPDTDPLLTLWKWKTDNSVLLSRAQ